MRLRVYRLWLYLKGYPPLKPSQRLVIKESLSRPATMEITPGQGKANQATK